MLGTQNFQTKISVDYGKSVSKPEIPIERTFLSICNDSIHLQKTRYSTILMVVFRIRFGSLWAGAFSS